MFGGIVRWLNLEKGVFLSASLVLALVAYRFFDSPSLGRFAPQRCDEMPTDDLESIRETGRLELYTSGSRDNPFAPFREARLVVRGPLSEVDVSAVSKENSGNDTETETETETATETETETETESGGVPTSNDDYVLKGRLRIAGGQNHIFFKKKERDEWVAAREGQKLPGTRLEVLRVEGDVVTVRSNDGHIRVFKDLVLPEPDTSVVH